MEEQARHIKIITKKDENGNNLPDIKIYHKL